MVVRRGQIRGIGWVIKVLEAQTGQFLVGCKCPVSRDIVVQEQDHLGNLPSTVFLQKVLQLHQQRWVILRVYSLVLWKIMPSWSQKIEARTFRTDFCTRNFLGCGEPLWRHCIDCCFVSGSYWYNQVSTMVINRDRKSFGSRRKNSKSCSHEWHLWRLWSAFRHFGTHFAESFRMSKSSWMMDPTLSCEMPSCSVIDLAEIRRSSKISSWIWSIISWMVTVLSRPGRGATQVEKSPCLNCATQFLTVAYDGACSPNVSLRITWISFSALSCKKKNFADSSRLHVVKIARVAWHASFPPL